MPHHYLYAFLCSCIFISSSFIIMDTPSTHTFTVKFTHLRNTKGLVQAALLNGSKGFPDDPKERYVVGKTTISGNSATIVFENIPTGKYVVVVMHDENSNTKLDKNFLGIPKEGFGFSNNPRILTGAPNYKDCEVSITQDCSHTVEMKYIF